MTPLQVFNKKNATKEQLRAALAEVLNVEYKPPEPKNKDENPLFKPCLNVFLAQYQKTTGLEYSITPKDGKALKSIIEKVTKVTTTGDVQTTFQFIILNLPPWYVKNAFSLSVIDSKFNEIIGSIRNSKNTVSHGYKQRIVDNLFGNNK
jgi:hypothetical protein